MVEKNKISWKGGVDPPPTLPKLKNSVTISSEEQAKKLVKNNQITIYGDLILECNLSLPVKLMVAGDILCQTQDKFGNRYSINVFEVDSAGNILAGDINSDNLWAKDVVATNVVAIENIGVQKLNVESVNTTNLSAYDIEGLTISAVNIRAFNIRAITVEAKKNIDARSIDARNVIAQRIRTERNIRAEGKLSGKFINAYDIYARHIDAGIINFVTICIAVKTFRYSKITGSRTNSLHECLDNKMIRKA